jgi:DNA-binding winged helix-turn-helix (wHTH) protein/tetratricopeptide (TPR) repeat protein
MTNIRPVKAYQFDGFTLDLDQHSLATGSKALKVNAKAFAILRLLVEQHGTVVDKERLLAEVWPDRIVEEGNLSVHIFSLRKILKSENPKGDYIETIPGTGYRFRGRVSETAEGTENEPDIAVSSPVASSSRASFDLIVLPFRHDRTASDTSYFADGFTNSLIGSLSRLPHLRVLSSDTAFHYKASAAAPQQIGQALGVDAVVTGKIESRDNEFAIEVEVVNTVGTEAFWKATFSGSAFDVFKIQEAITLGIAERLRLRLSKKDKQSLTLQATNNPEAYRQFLKGQYFLSLRKGHHVRKAAEFFRQATVLDPDYSLAYACLADSYMLLSGYGWEPCARTISIVRRAIEQAQATGPDLATTHSSRGLFKIVYRLDWQTAEADFRRALELNPASPRTYSRLSAVLAWKGDFTRARELINRALEIDPLSFYLYGILQDSFHLTRDFDRAVAIAHEVLALDPDEYASLYSIGKNLSHLGRHEEGLSFLERAYQLEPHPDIVTEVCLTHLRAGRISEARAKRRELEQMASSQYVEALDYAMIHAAFGEFDQAFHSLNLSLEERSFHLFYVKWDPRFDSLRNDERFAHVLRQIGYGAD